MEKPKYSSAKKSVKNFRIITKVQRVPMEVISNYTLGIYRSIQENRLVLEVLPKFIKHTIGIANRLLPAKSLIFKICLILIWLRLEGKFKYTQC